MVAIIVAFGQPKSASTFLFQVARRAAMARNGGDDRALRERLSSALGSPWADFHQSVDAGLVDTIASALEPNETAVIKTHGPLDASLGGHLARRTVVAFTSLRDPRETALSMVDAGVRDRAAGAARTYFQAMLRPSEPRTVEAQRQAVKNLRTQLANPFVLAVPYEAIAAAQDRVILRLTSHLGLRGYAEVVAQHFARERATRITEYNVGTPFRFATTLPAEEIAALNAALGSEIAFVDGVILRAMARFGLVNRYFALRAQHRAALAPGR